MKLSIFCGFLRKTHRFFAFPQAVFNNDGLPHRWIASPQRWWKHWWPRNFKRCGQIVHELRNLIKFDQFCFRDHDSFGKNWWTLMKSDGHISVSQDLTTNWNLHRVFIPKVFVKTKILYKKTSKLQDPTGNETLTRSPSRCSWIGKPWSQHVNPWWRNWRHWRRHPPKNCCVRRWSCELFFGKWPEEVFCL